LPLTGVASVGEKDLAQIPSLHVAAEPKVRINARQAVEARPLTSLSSRIAPISELASTSRRSRTAEKLTAGTPRSSRSWMFRRPIE
jgi:hypothetical protein